MTEGGGSGRSQDLVEQPRHRGVLVERVEVQTGGKAADDSQEKAEDDAGEEGEVEHLTYLQKSISTYRFLFLSP